MKNKIFLALAAFSLLFLTGCISIDVYHKQNADGSAVVKEVVDLSKYYEQMASAGTGLGEGYPTYDSNTAVEEFSKMCDNVPSDVKCTLDQQKYVITLEKTFAKDSFFKLESSGDFLSSKYKLTVDEMPNFGDLSGGQGDEIEVTKLTDPSNVDAAQGLQMMGIVYTYTVEMPGKITKADGGVIDKNNPNVVKFDIVERMDKQKPIVVEAEGSSLCPVGAFLLFLAVGFAALNSVPRR